MKFLSLLTVSTVIITSYNLQARPQYSAAKGINDCAACHYSPAGGGPKTVFGKITGSHGFPPAPRSMKDVISGEVRAMAFGMTEKTSKNHAGVSIMAGNLSGAIDILDNAQGKTHIVAAYDFLGYIPSAREAFIRWQSKERKNFSPQYMVVGKFNIPFGILTDEHRSYVRQQTYTSSNEYEMGGMISGDLAKMTHYDLAIVQGFQQGSGMSGDDISWGVIPNIRIMFQSAHLYIGFSGLYYQNSLVESPWAAAAYMVWAPTTNFSIMTEIDYAKNLNGVSDINGSYLKRFVDPTASSTYYNELLDKESLGAMVRLDYSINNKWTIYNKTDFLAPDENFLKDHYIKNGIGFKYFINSNMDLDIRFDKKYISRDGIEETEVSTSKDMISLLGHVWF